MTDPILSDYWHAKRAALYWARIAIERKSRGEPWQCAARNAHDALCWALLIIR